MNKFFIYKLFINSFTEKDNISNFFVKKHLENIEINVLDFNHKCIFNSENCFSLKNT